MWFNLDEFRSFPFRDPNAAKAVLCEKYTDAKKARIGSGNKLSKGKYSKSQLIDAPIDPSVCEKAKEEAESLVK